MFSEIEARVRKCLRWMDRCEWAIRWLKLNVSSDAAEKPGLLLIQVDGLARRQLEIAMREGRCPFLKGLVTREGHMLRTFYSGLPSSTPAVQGELLYGVRSAVPAFSYRDPRTGMISDLFHPDLVRAVEDELSGKGAALLAGGSSWSNIYSGGAAKEDTHFCISRIDEDLRPRNLMRRLAVFVLFPGALVKVALMMLSELFQGAVDAISGIVRGQNPVKEAASLVARLCAGIALRELITIGVRIDLARGLPIIHANYIGYDDMSHRRGPASRFAHWSLQGIDHSIQGLFMAAHGSMRRDYQVWIFSDHGQESTRPFDHLFGKSISSVIAQALESLSQDASEEPRRKKPEEGRSGDSPEIEESSFQFADMGPVGHLYLPERPDKERMAQIARNLIEYGVPGVLIRIDGILYWVDDVGSHSVERGAALPGLHGYPAELAEMIVDDLQRLAAHPDAGHFVLLGWSVRKPTITFTAENGSHAGPGIDETQGFLIVPPTTSMPAKAMIRPTDLRDAVFSLLENRSLSPRAEVLDSPTEIKILSYNVHGCMGSDGRISPRRIARIIRESKADVVAVQELDRQRSRSRTEDQVSDIAVSLGFHHLFCPTVIKGQEQYGHAVFSRYPLEKVKIDYIPSVGATLWKEPRAALWCRLRLGHRSLHLVTTHLGLGRAERRAQVAALLGTDWLDGMQEGEAVILCGDMNFQPGGYCHRQIIRSGFRDTLPQAAKTFGSSLPVVRLDHVFASAGLEVYESHVVSNHLTRVASDHLPIIARLGFKEDFGTRMAKDARATHLAH